MLAMSTWPGEAPEIADTMACCRVDPLTALPTDETNVPVVHPLPWVMTGGPNTAGS